MRFLLVLLCVAAFVYAAAPTGCYKGIIPPLRFQLSTYVWIINTSSVGYDFSTPNVYAFSWEGTYEVDRVPYNGGLWLNGSVASFGSEILFGEPTVCNAVFLDEQPPFDLCQLADNVSSYGLGEFYSYFNANYSLLTPKASFAGGVSAPRSLFGLQSLLLRAQAVCKFIPLRGSCCDSRCYSFESGFNNYSTACQVVDDEAACTALGASYAWGGPGTTCRDGSCAGACCCNSTGTCTPFPSGITPYQCSLNCSIGTWGGASNFKSCTGGTCDPCLGPWSQFPLVVPVPSKRFTLPPPDPVPLGLCYWGGCIPMNGLDPSFEACYDSMPQQTCYDAYPGFTWEEQEVLDCYSGYIRPFCSDAMTGGGTQVCFDNALWSDARDYAGFGGTSFYYGNLHTSIGCPAPPVTPVPCPPCPGYVPPTPPPPTPAPPTVYSLFNVTGACCATTCRLTDADDNGCVTTTETACNSFGGDFVYKGDFSSCDDGISCTAGCCNNVTSGACTNQMTWNNCVNQAELLNATGVWAGGGNPGQFVQCTSGGYCTPPSAACTIPLPPPPSPTPPPVPPPRTGACVKVRPAPATSFLCADVPKDQCENFENPEGDVAFLKRETTCAHDTWGACCCGSVGSPGLIGFCGTVSTTDCARHCNGTSAATTGFFYGQGSSINCQDAFNHGCPYSYQAVGDPSDPCDWLCFLPYACIGGQCG